MLANLAKLAKLANFRRAQTTLRMFSERIKGRRGWTDMHTRMAWSGSHLSARQGDYRRAHRQVKSACVQLRYNGLVRETSPPPSIAASSSVAASSPAATHPTPRATSSPPAAATAPT